MNNRPTRRVPRETGPVRRCLAQVMWNEGVADGLIYNKVLLAHLLKEGGDIVTRTKVIVVAGILLVAAIFSSFFAKTSPPSFGFGGSTHVEPAAASTALRKSCLGQGNKNQPAAPRCPPP